MGKNNKQAAIPEAAPKTTPVEVADPNKAAMTDHFIKNYAGMSPDSTVTALERIAKMVHDDPKACEHLDITPEHQKFLNELVLTGMTTMVITDVIAQKSAFAITMSKANFEIVKRIAAEIGAPFVGNYLPTPAEGENVTVDITEKTIEVTNETKSQIKEETKTAEEVVEVDPTKFKSEEDLAAALKYIMVSEKGAFVKFQRSTALLKSYRLIQAGEDKDKKEAINNESVGDLLNEVFAIVGRMPIVLSGFGKFLYRETSQILNPALAFCKLRDASKNDKGTPAMSSLELAGITRNLIEYCANDGISSEEAKIAGFQKDIEVLSKDKKKNASGIKDLENKIETSKANIQHFKDVIDCAHNPSSSFADTFLEDYTDPANENYKNARKAYAYVVESYFDREKAKEANQDQMKKDVQQILGIVTNFFRNPSEQNTEYSVSRLTIIPTDQFEETSKN